MKSVLKWNKKVENMNNYNCNQRFTNESNLGIKYTIRNWYAFKQIDPSKPS